MEELVVRAQKDIFDRSLVDASGSFDSEVRMPTLERRRGTCEGRNLEPRGLSVGFLIHGTSFLIRNQDLNLEHPT